MKLKLCRIATTVMTTLCLTGGSLLAAQGGAPMTHELAAKRETVRRQQEQRITPEKRKAAAEALKAERLRVFNARKAVQQPAPAGAPTWP